MRDPEERFFEKVVVGDCWEWVGARNSSGYGQFWYQGAMRVAHGWAWRHLVGPVAEGLQLDHLCRNRACVNPDHLQPVSASVNVRRGAARAGHNARKTRCLRGHLLDGDNLRMRGSDRQCKTCQRAHDRRHRERAKALARAA